MTKDFKRFTISVEDFESSNLPKGISYAKRENALEVRISWDGELRTPDPVMESRALYVFTKFMEIEENFLNINRAHKCITISRCDGLGFGKPVAPVVPEVLLSEAEHMALHTETTLIEPVPTKEVSEIITSEQRWLSKQADIASSEMSDNDCNEVAEVIKTEGTPVVPNTGEMFTREADSAFVVLQEKLCTKEGV